MKKNILIVHGGGPTAVMNASLFGAVSEARKNKEVTHIYAAKNGTGGILREEFIDLSEEPMERLKLLLSTPGSAIGSSRDWLEEEAYEKMTEIMLRYQIGYVLFNGGNGTMDTCGRLYQMCCKKSLPVSVMGIPKTIDNDLAITDHSPGYGSAARYMAQSVREVCADVRGLPIHVVVIEASGRNAGWIAAASALADQGDGLGPDLIYLPERPFEEERYLADIKALLKKKKGLVVVASEGLRDGEGRPVVKPILQRGRERYFGDVSAHLANLVIQHLGYKARNEKPGLLGRASIALQSVVDREEAQRAGELACQACLSGESGKMIAFERISDNPYKIRTVLVELDKVMMYEKKMPDMFINEQGNGVTDCFIQWCRPLVGEFQQMITFNAV